MVAPKKNRPVAGQRQADHHAQTSTTDAPLILAHRVSALTCAYEFMIDDDAPCYDVQDRLAHAAAALFVEDFLSDEGRGYCYDAEILGRIVASWMHVPYALGHRIIGALVDRGLLVGCGAPGVM